MRVLPILFSAPMVRALLDGRKKMTRRVLKPQPVGRMMPLVSYNHGVREIAFGPENKRADGGPRWWRLAEPGDLLWVREAIARVPASAYLCSEGVQQTINPADPYEAAVYRASFDRSGNPGWRPSIHMPRWASRLTLAVTAVKVERLQDISEEDAFAEGVETDAWDMAPVAKRYGTEGWFVGWPMGVSEPCVSVDEGEVCRRSFASLWNSINGPGAWEANPWVAAITFAVHRANVDQLTKDRHSSPPPDG